MIPGYGESIRSVGVDYAEEAQPSDPDRGDASIKSDPEVTLASELPLERTDRRCKAQAGHSGDCAALIGAASRDLDWQRRAVMAVQSSSDTSRFGAAA